jgi:hypothetical protein
MQLILPDVLIEARGLSVGASGFFLFIGILLWGFGWRWHRFWIAFGITVAAGLIGLNAGRASEATGQVMAITILFAFSAGVLALELAKILAFVSGGTVAWIGTANLLPGVQELWVVFMCGGLLGVVMYRLWLMIATSFLGVLLCWHVLFVLAESLIKLDSPKFVTDHGSALSGGLIVVGLLGVLVQNWTGGSSDAASDEAEKDDDEDSSKDDGKNHSKKK